MAVYNPGMRRVKYEAGISLDGYIARPDGAFDFLLTSEDFSLEPFFNSIDTIVMGRKTYDVSQSMGGGPGFGSTAVYVFSSSLPPGERNGVTVVSGSVRQFVDTIRSTPGKDIWLMGGSELARQFLDEDLVDEVSLGIVPVLIGAGIPAFPPGFPQRDLELVENKTFSKGLIHLTYRRTRA